MTDAWQPHQWTQEELDAARARDEAEEQIADDLEALIRPDVDLTKVIKREYKVAVYVEPGHDPDQALADMLEFALDRVDGLYDARSVESGAQTEVTLDERGYPED